MRIGVESFTLNKRFPLTISRGTTSQTTNLWLRVEQEGIKGWGEASPKAIAKPDSSASISGEEPLLDTE